MKPRRSILSPDFHYTSSANTDLRKTFKQARQRMARERASKALKQMAGKDACANGTVVDAAPCEFTHKH